MCSLLYKPEWITLAIILKSCSMKNLYLSDTVSSNPNYVA